MKKILKTISPFSFPPFSFFLSFILLFSFFLLSCSSPTATSKGSLTGTVSLEGESDFSGITVALYDLTELDPNIVYANETWPHIGVIINQHTEFDHRFQAPIKFTETLADGSFEIKKIPVGTYNFVAIKDSFGFKYLYEIEISKGDNDLSQLTILYAETLFTDQVPTTTFLADHHYIIDNPYGEVVLYNNSLIIQPGAVVRITPYTDFVIAGNLLAQGEENNMFWVTSNSGLENSQLTIQNSPLSSEDIELYNSMELSSLASVEDDLIEWGKWGWGNTCLLNQFNNLHMENGIFRNGNCGFKNSDTDSTFCKKIITNKCNGEMEAGIYFYNASNGLIEQNIINDCISGIVTRNFSSPIIKNNYFLNCMTGINVSFYSNSQIFHNDVLNCEKAIDIRFDSSPTIEYNNFAAATCIYFRELHQEDFLINYCNLNYLDYSINEGEYCFIDINATKNFFYTIESDEIFDSIYDKNDVLINQQNYSYILFEPFLNEICENAGIENPR